MSSLSTPPPSWFLRRFLAAGRRDGARAVACGSAGWRFDGLVRTCRSTERCHTGALHSLTPRMEVRTELLLLRLDLSASVPRAGEEDGAWPGALG